ncbi:MAG: LLM class flavin-dependent oxidoreductase [Chloroflexi bacterium]|nr:LLM class flavin-dependent oxidoreductase [Chloroflexota bacterium]
MPPRIRLAVAQPNHNILWDEYLELVRAADGMQYETFWSFDHLMPIGGDMNGSCHECYTTLAAFAAATKRIRIGALVSGAAYRNPAMTLKLATQVDVIAGGRFDFGIGAGWAEREFKAFQIPFGEPKERIGMLREMLALATQVWSGDPHKRVTYHGKYVHADDLFLNPQPLQRPRPPIVIGGGGEQLTLRVVARYADMWHGFGDLATLGHKLKLIDEYARGYGRDPQSIVRSTHAALWVGEVPAEVRERASGGRRPATFISGTPRQIVDGLKPYLDLGITYFILSSPGGIDLKNWQRVSDEVIPILN